MINKYTIAGINVVLDSGDIIIAESGFTPLFKSDFENADVRYMLHRCVELPFEMPYNLYCGTHIKASCDGERICLTYLSRNTGKEYLRLIKRIDNDSSFDVYLKEKELFWISDLYYLFPVLGFHSVLHDYAALMIHASFIMKDGEAILFTAPSGGGKTTQAELWQENFSAEIINGYRAIIREKDGIFYAYSLPIAGTSGECQNREFPLKAIVVLSHGSLNVLMRTKATGAVKGIVTNSVFYKWSERDTGCAYDTAIKIAGSIPVYSLSCLPDKSAAELLFSELRRNC